MPCRVVPCRAVAVQDAWVIQERLGGQDMLMFGVFDGHGQEGKTVSHGICTNLPKALAKHAACKVRGWVRSAQDAAATELLSVCSLALNHHRSSCMHCSGCADCAHK